MEDMTEADKQKIVAQIEGDDFISGIDLADNGTINDQEFNPIQDAQAMQQQMAGMNVNNN